MGEVYPRPRHRLAPGVALKIVPSRGSRRPGARARFEREARSRRAQPSEHRRHVRPRRGPRRLRRWSSSSSTGQTLADRLAAGPLLARGSAGPRATDAAGPRRRARARHRSPRPEARQHRGDARRHGEGARLRAREGLGPTIRRRRHVGPTITGAATGRHDARHAGVHEPGAGARPGRRQANRHLVVRLRALRNADRARDISGADTPSDIDRCDSHRRSGLAAAAGDDTRSTSGRCCGDVWRRIRGSGSGISATHGSSLIRSSRRALRPRTGRKAIRHRAAPDNVGVAGAGSGLSARAVALIALTFAAATWLR